MDGRFRHPKMSEIKYMEKYIHFRIPNLSRSLSIFENDGGFKCLECRLSYPGVDLLHIHHLIHHLKKDLKGKKCNFHKSSYQETFWKIEVEFKVTIVKENLNVSDIPNLAEIENKNNNTSCSILQVAGYIRYTNFDICQFRSSLLVRFFGM